MSESPVPVAVTERALRAVAGRQPALEEAICPACGATNRAAARFCLVCIGPLKGTLADAQPLMLPHAPQYPATSSFTRVESPSESATSTHGLPNGTVIEGFKILRLLGQGGFGIVYLTWDSVLERHVALKEYMPATLAVRDSGTLAVTMRSERHRDTFEAGRKSFVNEARLLARFDHPALLKVFRCWEAHGTAYMAMAYYEGPTLKEAFASETHAPSEKKLREWLCPLLDALSTLHQAKCLHRDISPDNILLTSTGPVLLDFGAARRVITDMTQGLTAVLKPGFAPIEQYGGEMVQGPWTDLYALAGVIYHAITGRLPPASAARVVRDAFEPLSASHRGRYSKAFLHAIDSTLSLRPESRPQDVAQFRALIDDPAAARRAQSTVTRGQGMSEAPPSDGRAAGARRASLRRALLATHGWTTLYISPATAEPAPAEAPGRRVCVAPTALLALALTIGSVAWFVARSGQATDEARPTDMPAPASPSAAARRTGTTTSLAVPLPTLSPPPARAPADTPGPRAHRPIERAAPERAAVTAAKPAPMRATLSTGALDRADPPRAAEGKSKADVTDTGRQHRCSDLVLKSSLDGLSADEITFQRTECK
ncbi:protein kinase [Variovorax sp. J22P271]|uniref:protein kinase domain-containing protein n=1 Tax=Variovorax davisae TaxID=3053515 RepID=UPI002574D291|nr:protein kinase [Variovorax sp. J22P271]MDM0032226.1 protein kinase [Variovorax sp. J22P271]